jgi:hypothetical protein
MAMVKGRRSMTLHERAYGTSYFAGTSRFGSLKKAEDEAMRRS